MEQSRKPYYRLAERIYRDALIKQMQPVIDYFTQTGAVGPYDAVELIARDRLDDAFEYVYKTVGVDFAKREFGRLATQEAEQLRGMFERFMGEYVQRTAGDRVTAITGTSKEYAQRIIQNVIGTAEQGIGTDKLGLLLEKELKKSGARISTWRARVIARTEVVTASNMGQQIGAEALDMPMTKTWLATGDRRTRDMHLMADGQTVPMRSYFLVGGEQMYVPGDASASAMNTVNCRCAVVYNVTR